MPAHTPRQLTSDVTSQRENSASHVGNSHRTLLRQAALTVAAHGACKLHDRALVHLHTHATYTHMPHAVDSTHSSNAHARRRHAHRPRATGGTQDPRRPPRCGGAVIVICTHLADAPHSPR